MRYDDMGRRFRGATAGIQRHNVPTKTLVIFRTDIVQNQVNDIESREDSGREVQIFHNGSRSIVL